MDDIDLDGRSMYFSVCLFKPHASISSLSQAGDVFTERMDWERAAATIAVELEEDGISSFNSKELDLYGLEGENVGKPHISKSSSSETRGRCIELDLDRESIAEEQDEILSFNSKELDRYGLEGEKVGKPHESKYSSSEARVGCTEDMAWSLGFGVLSGIIMH